MVSHKIREISLGCHLERSERPMHWANSNTWVLRFAQDDSVGLCHELAGRYTSGLRNSPHCPPRFSVPAPESGSRSCWLRWARGPQTAQLERFAARRATAAAEAR